MPGFSWHGIDKSVPNQGLSTRWAYVEPRVGLAWDVYGAGNTVLRAGAGVYRAHDSFNDASSGSSTVLGLRTPSVNLIKLSSISSQASTATASNGLTYDTNENAFLAGDDKQPQVYTWNTAIDQKLGKGVVMEVAYVGNHSNDLLNNGANANTNLDDLNALPIGSLYGPQPANQAVNSNRGVIGNGPGSVYPLYDAPGQTTTTIGSISQATIDAYKKYQVYDRVLVAQHNLYANYDALQVSVIKQAGKAHFGANYSWSHALGILGSFDVGNPSNPFNVRDNYQSETYDRHHIFNASYSYSAGDLVKNHLVGIATNGWEVSGITTIQSGPDLTTTASTNFGLGGNLTIPNGVNPTTGAPVTAQIGITNTNLLGTPDVTLQPTLLCSDVKGTGAHRYINPGCFGVPTQLGVNGAYRLPFLGGPVFFDTDLTAAKNFKINEHNNVQLKIAAFNFLNHALNSFTGVDGNATTLNFTNSGDTLASAAATAKSQYPEFGTAPLKEGRRILELSLRYDF